MNAGEEPLPQLALGEAERRAQGGQPLGGGQRAAGQLRCGHGLVDQATGQCLDGAEGGPAQGERPAGRVWLPRPSLGRGGKPRQP